MTDDPRAASLIRQAVRKLTRAAENLHAADHTGRLVDCEGCKLAFLHLAEELSALLPNSSNRWRVIVTDTEGPTGVAPVCPRQAEPGGPHDLGPAQLDEAGVYDCCPHPHIECWGERAATEIARQLTAADAEVCS